MGRAIMSYDSPAPIEAAYSPDDYDAVCAAVSASARGRWFLAEYMRRQQDQEARRVVQAGADHPTPLESGSATDDALTGELAEIVSALAALREMDAERARQLTELVHHLERRLASMVQPEGPVQETSKPEITPWTETNIRLIDTFAHDATGTPSPEPEPKATSVSVVELMPIDFVPAASPRPSDLGSTKPSVDRKFDSPPVRPPEVEPSLSPAESPFVASAPDLGDLEQDLFVGRRAQQSVVVAKPEPMLQGRAAANSSALSHDPLAAFKAMTAEEQIALFS